MHSGGRDRSNIYFSAAQAVSRALGSFIVGGYASLYLRLTRPLDRRMELAADVLSARLAGRAAAIRALETVALLIPQYELYLQQHVGLALNHGAMPSDLLDGFHLFRKRIEERGLAKTLLASIHERKTDRFDSHPALVERVHALQARPEDAQEDDVRPATALLTDQEAFARWLATSTYDLFSVLRPVKKMVWDEIPARALAPSLEERASELVRALRSRYDGVKTAATSFLRVNRDVARGEGFAVALHLEPRVAHVPDPQGQLTQQVLASCLGGLFVGALLERGASIEPSLGEPCLVFRFEGERVEPESLIAAAMTDRTAMAVLETWGKRLRKRAETDVVP